MTNYKLQINSKIKNSKLKTDSKFEILNSKLRIVFMGTPEIGAQLFESLLKSGLNISACITRPDKPKGRSGEISESPVKQVATNHNIPVYQPANKLELTEIIKNIAPDLVIIGAFGMIIPKEAIDVPKFGMINFHPSLLPLYRGPSPVIAPILNGDKKTGVSIMLISEGMDEGDILDQQEVVLTGKETLPELSEKLAALGGKMLLQILPNWLDGKISPHIQNHKRATYTKMVKKENGKINWTNQTATDIERMSRAYTPWPGIYSFWKGKKIDFYNTVTLDENLKPGQVVNKDNQILIGAKSGSIFPAFIKIEGKNKVATEDFIRGYPDFVNANLN